MNIFESMRSAISGIAGNKMRSLLTMFGIIVGISSVITISSVGQGVKSSINQEFESIGMDVIELYVSSENDIIEQNDYLQNDDEHMLRQYSGIAAISPVTRYTAPDGVTYLGRNETQDVNMIGINQDYFKTQPATKLLHGRYILKQDVENELNTVVIDETFARDFIGRADCIGETLKVNVRGETQSLTVIGVLESDESDMMIAMYNRPGTIYVPISLVQKFVSSENPIQYMMIKVSDRDKLAEISQNIIRLMEFKHGNSDKYDTWSISSFMDEFNTIINIFTVFLTFVAGISLLVGGIGVMNIMLVSVTERTREIGIRKSLGATNFNIRIQFLIEAIILTGIGGVIGMATGYGLGILLSKLASMVMQVTITPYISVSTVLLVVAISAAIGIVFGVYPAVKASKLDPVESLRFE